MFVSIITSRTSKQDLRFFGGLSATIPWWQMSFLRMSVVHVQFHDESGVRQRGQEVANGNSNR